MKTIWLKYLLHGAKSSGSLLISSLFGLSILGATPLMANALSLDTFNFTQGGYVTPNGIGTLSGSFTATVGMSSIIGIGDLQNIQDNFAFPVGNGITAILYGYNVQFFSYNINGGNSSLDLEGSIGPAQTVCVGAVAAFGFGNCNTVGGPAPINGWVGLSSGFFTAQLPEINLVSSVPIIVPTVPLDNDPTIVTMTFMSSSAVAIAWKRKFKSTNF